MEEEGKHGKVKRKGRRNSGENGVDKKEGNFVRMREEGQGN